MELARTSAVCHLVLLVKAIYCGRFFFRLSDIQAVRGGMHTRSTVLFIEKLRFF
ncbi:Uncharacterised protein [Halioglobus japonicus]|nr:Uncharacterised protein [Halioglobus japonicus]